MLYVSKGLENHKTAQISFYDLNGNKLPFKRTDYDAISTPLTLPSNFGEMRDIARRIATNIGSRFVRIDLYSINEKTYFSEITFYPCAGMMPFDPKEWDKELGSWIKL